MTYTPDTLRQTIARRWLESSLRKSLLAHAAAWEADLRQRHDTVLARHKAVDGLLAEIATLRQRLEQAKGALGYSVSGDIPEGDFVNGIADALSQRLEAARTRETLSVKFWRGRLEACEEQRHLQHLETLRLTGEVRTLRQQLAAAEKEIQDMRKGLHMGEEEWPPLAAMTNANLPPSEATAIHDCIHNWMLDGTGQWVCRCGLRMEVKYVGTTAGKQA